MMEDDVKRAEQALNQAIFEAARARERIRQEEIIQEELLLENIKQEKIIQENKIRQERAIQEEAVYNRRIRIAQEESVNLLQKLINMLNRETILNKIVSEADAALQEVIAQEEANKIKDELKNTRNYIEQQKQLMCPSTRRPPCKPGYYEDNIRDSSGNLVMTCCFIDPNRDDPTKVEIAMKITLELMKVS